VDLNSAGQVLALAAAIVAIGGGAAAVYHGISKWYSRTVGSRRALAAQLNQLGAGVTVRWIEERLGVPAFARDFPHIPGARELVFHTRHAWVQVIVDEYDAVARFSVTVTDPRFRFQVRDLTHHQLSAVLGHTSFADAGRQHEPQGQSLRTGAHNHEYAEAYWFGNPGAYQWYVLSRNDAVGTGAIDYSVGGHGQTSFQTGVLESGANMRPDSIPKSDQLALFRTKSLINTLTVLGPWRAPTDGTTLGRSALAEPRGPDSNQIRVIAPDVRELRRRRRRIRRMNRMIRRAQGKSTRHEEPAQPDVAIPRP
jgi:hypothetical protein